MNEAMHTFPEFEAHLRRRVSPATVRIRLYWLRRLAAVVSPLNATEDDLWGFVEADPTWTPNTRATVITSFRVFYGWAKRRGLVDEDPTTELLTPSIPRPVSRITADSVIRSALAGATDSERAMLLLGAECGLRRSEIAGLRLDDRDGDWLSVRGKGGKVRPLRASPELCDTLDAMERTSARDGFYFPGMNGGHVEASTVWRHVRALTGLNTHALRHRAGTTVFRQTKDIRVAQEFLGHANVNTTAIYLHVELDDLSRASEASRLAA